MPTEIHQHRDPHGRRLYATTTGDRIVLVTTTPASPGVARVELTAAEWQALAAAVTAALADPGGAL